MVGCHKTNHITMNKSWQPSFKIEKLRFMGSKFTWSYVVGCHVTLSATSSRMLPTITAHESAGAGLEQIFIDLKTDFAATGQISSSSESSESSESSRSSSISSSQSSWCHTCPRQNKQAECRPPYPLWQRSRHQEWRNPQNSCQLP